MSKSTSRKAPCVWDYFDPVSFLRDTYQFRKDTQVGISYASWALQLNIKSRSFIRLVLIGKRALTVSVAELFAENLNLTGPEKNYFLNLVRLQRSQKLADRELHSREVARLRHRYGSPSTSTVDLSSKHYFDYFSSYKIPRLRVLLTIPELVKTPETLAELLKVKVSDCMQYLETLANLGLAETTDTMITAKSNWSATTGNLRSPDSLGNVALQSYHRQSLQESIEAIKLPADIRNYQSLLLTLSPDQYELLKQELHQTLRDVLSRYSGFSAEDQKIYQINLNLIPVTESIFRQPKAVAPTTSPEQKENHEALI